MAGKRMAMLALGLAAVALGAPGCGPDAKDKRINELTQQLDQARSDLNNRDQQINDLTQREEDSQAAIRNLNKELGDLRAKVAKAGQGPEDGKWIGMPGFDMISIPGEVLFDSGKATLKPAGRTTLDRIASDIRARYADRDIYVVGHTDDEPIRKSGWKDNWQLGAERSLTAARYLIGAGIPPSKIVQASCSYYRPRMPNTSADSRRQNRRVEFYAVIKHDTSLPSGGDEMSSTGAP